MEFAGVNFYGGRKPPFPPPPPPMKNGQIWFCVARNRCERVRLVDPVSGSVLSAWHGVETVDLRDAFRPATREEVKSYLAPPPEKAE